MALKRKGHAMSKVLKAGEDRRTDTGAEVQQRVAELLAELRKDGEAAVRRLSAELDSWTPPSFRLTGTEIDAATAGVGEPLKTSLHRAADRIRRFAEHQRGCLLPLEVELEPVFVASHRPVPVGSVGAYMPGGGAHP